MAPIVRTEKAFFVQGNGPVNAAMIIKNANSIIGNKNILQKTYGKTNRKTKKLSEGIVALGRRTGNYFPPALIPPVFLMGGGFSAISSRMKPSASM